MTTKRKSVAVGRPAVMRHTNAQSILALLREAGTCSRADLVRASGLSAPTITNVVRDLLAADLVEALGEGVSSRGRPPDIIGFRARRGCVLAVQITSLRLSFLLSDLDGTELASREVSLARKETTPVAICRYIREEVGMLLRGQGMTRRQLLVIVAAVPAITNVIEGKVLAISTFQGWRNVPLAAMLRKIFACKVVIENDTNLAALGERYRGAAQEVDSFVFISIDTNVGAGIVLDGRLHHGAEWSAGEIAYLRLPNTPRKRPTLFEFGELESILTSSGIMAEWQALGGRKPRQALTALDILDLAESGNSAAEKIVQSRASTLADIVLNLSLILNPALILLGGSIGSHPALLRGVQRQLEGSEFGVLRVASGELGDSGVLWGAILLALEFVPEVLLPADM